MSFEPESIELLSRMDYEQMNSFSSENEDKSISKKTTVRIIIFIAIVIAIFLIITVILIIKLPSLLYGRKTSSTTINFNINTGSTVVKYAPIMTEVGRGGTSGDAPCQSHTVVDDPTRSVSNEGFNGLCDDDRSFLNTSLGGRWIRFVGKGGTRVSNTFVNRGHCGAFLSLWIDASLPLTIGDSVNATACWSISVNGCFRLNEYTRCSIMNCGDFYVYFLSPTILCNARYCTI